MSREWVLVYPYVERMSAGVSLCRDNESWCILMVGWFFLDRCAHTESSKYIWLFIAAKSTKSWCINWLPRRNCPCSLKTKFLVLSCLVDCLSFVILTLPEWQDMVEIHYPSTEMVCSSKISCISWSSFHKSMLASSDYEVTVHFYPQG
jgi:hypothetical protein